ncbi:MAG: hypothetical protein M0R21_00790 [Lentimicrobiaceae bacterium]|nr:hypothetical protein [Lentimicrobiaceae bacterium]
MKRNNILTFTALLVLTAFLFLGSLSCKKLDIKRLAAIQTENAYDINSNSAKLKCSVIDLGDKSFYQLGFFYSTSPDVDESDVKIEIYDYPDTGVYYTYLSGLQENTNYYLKAFMYNGTDYVLGEEKNFSTTPLTGLPTVTTYSPVYNITSTTAECRGEVTNDGGYTVYARGVCWSIYSNPTISDAHTNDQSGMGTFYSYMTDLQPNTTYYVKAYASNTYGTAYGSQIYFTTLSGGAQTHTFRWDDGTNHDGIGLTEGGSFHAAIRLDPSHLADYNGWRINKITFYPKSSSTQYAIEGFVGSDPNPESPVFFQSILSPVINAYNEILLATNVYIDASQELHVGIKCMNQPVGEYPAGVDDGPAIAGYGDCIHNGSWNNLSTYSLNYNWNITMEVSSAKGETKILTADSQPVAKTQITYSKSKGKAVSSSKTIKK